MECCVIRSFQAPNNTAHTVNALRPHLVLESLSASTHPTAGVMNKLVNFTALTTCCLRSDFNLGTWDVDLTPLQSLEKLTSLRLAEKHFMNVNSASHLTHLHVVDVQGTSCSECRFCSSLIKLTMFEGCLVALHANGMGACTTLKSLDLYGSCSIDAARYAESFDIDVPRQNTIHIPGNLSSLGLLTELQSCMETSWDQLEITKITIYKAFCPTWRFCVLVHVALPRTTMLSRL